MDFTRYSLVYFSRPQDDVLMKRLTGSDVIPELKEGEVDEDITSKDWIITRAISKRIGVFKQGDWEIGMGTEKQSTRSRL